LSSFVIFILVVPSIAGRGCAAWLRASRPGRALRSPLRDLAQRMRTTLAQVMYLGVAQSDGPLGPEASATARRAEWRVAKRRIAAPGD